MDLSAAFDTVDHTILLHNTTAILLHRLQKDFGVEANALHWFTTFITGRTQRVCIDGSSSDPHQLICEVPQGSVPGARLYIMCTQMLANVSKKHDVHHSYADNTQVYVRCGDNSLCYVINLDFCISFLLKIFR